MPAGRRFTYEQVRDMRHRWWLGATYGELAKEFGIHPHSVRAIITGDTYRNIPGFFSRAGRRERNVRLKRGERAGGW